MKIFPFKWSDAIDPAKEIESTLRKEKLSVLLEKVEAKGKYSPKTMKNYRMHTRRFIEFIGEDLTAEQVTMKKLEKFREHIMEDRSAQTARIGVDAICAIVKFASDDLLLERKKRTAAPLYMLRIDISDSSSDLNPGRLERVFKAMLTALNTEG
jgi:hypothetical protein